ncbi:MAG: DUF1971 domain-containing protein [Synechococcaceae cyanobacterium RL_1_2]|nr:DUF1971 domain-containing protein [Synechococcaceae cyanobacterium RL_1_2]
MKSLPRQVLPYKRTPDFTLSSLPTGLQQSHNTKAGVWGKIVILAGSVRYRILEPELEELLLTPDRYGIIEPTIKHEVIPDDRARFYVEFYR